MVGGKVLLIRRGRPPSLNAWSLPGGALKLGETISEGVVREVMEETGLPVTPVVQIGTFDRIVRDAEGRVRYHYVLLDWLCVPVRRTGAEEPQLCAGADAREAVWVKRERLRSMEGLDDIAIGVIEEALARPEGQV